ncbi:hypothetical protein NDU88_007776 [Pleurodeles waltl]|uniref:Uncharacterized protein n=1 Tax=Pleurodeles waltl TaxID=8319 RepID=A0AAV7PMM5_PLEWA|nr:hypothetical protein NDU88_007776 [Pleurodeles waltl]
MEPELYVLPMLVYLLFYQEYEWRRRTRLGRLTTGDGSHVSGGACVRGRCGAGGSACGGVCCGFAGGGAGGGAWVSTCRGTQEDVYCSLERLPTGEEAGDCR